MRSIVRMSSTAVLIALAVTATAWSAAVETGDSVRSACGVVSAGHPSAARAEAEILARGGNVVDAAAATAMPKFELDPAEDVAVSAPEICVDDDEPLPDLEGGRPTLRQPAFITSAGQSSGALMVQVLANRAGVASTYGESGGPEELEGAGSLIVVVGASVNGLGAAGIELEQEFERVARLLERAGREGIPVVAIHIEGSPRRDLASDELSELTFRYASRAVVRADGDDDGFFTALAARYGVDLVRVPSAAEAADALADLYSE